MYKIADFSIISEPSDGEGIKGSEDSDENTDSMNKKLIIGTIIGVIIVGTLIIGYYYYSDDVNKIVWDIGKYLSASLPFMKSQPESTAAPILSEEAKHVLSIAKSYAEIMTQETGRHSELINITKEQLNTAIAARAAEIAVENAEATKAAEAANMLASTLYNGKGEAIEPKLIEFDPKKIQKECLDYIFYTEQRRK